MIGKFLEKTFTDYFTRNPKGEIVLLLDNAKSNHTKQIYKLAKKFNILLLYKAVASTQLYAIEYFFEFAKRKIRSKLNPSKYLIINSIIEKARLFENSQVMRIWFRQQADFTKVINGDDLFIRSIKDEDGETDIYPIQD